MERRFYYVQSMEGKYEDIYAPTKKHAEKIGQNREQRRVNSMKIKSFDDLTLSVDFYWNKGKNKRYVATVEHIREDIQIRVYKDRNCPPKRYECDIIKNGTIDRDFKYATKEEINKIIKAYLEGKEKELVSTFEYGPYFKALGGNYE